MTDQNNAAQPGLTDDQIEALAKKHICPHHDRLDAVLPNRVPYQQTEQFRRVKALIGDVLSKLRAEGVQAGDEREIELHRQYAENATFRVWWDENQACPEHSLTTENAAHAAWQERGRRAALASAPVAGEAIGYSTGIQWRPRQSEQSIKLTRNPQPEYGFIHALYAAPQASEAVRNDGFSDGVITALEVMTSHGDWGSTAYCELLQAAGLEAVVRRAINEETWETAGLDRTPMAVECRAALSPTQPTEKGERDV